MRFFRFEIFFVPLYVRRSALVLAIALSASACEITEKFSGAAAGGTGEASTPRGLSFVESPSVDLGIVPVNSTKLVRLSVATTGVGDATLESTTNSDSRFSFNGGSFPGTGGTCMQPIQGNCSVAILFTAPTSAAGVGTYTNIVTIGYASGNSSKAFTISLSATVVVGATLTVNAAAPYAFGTRNVGSSNDATLTVTNSGLLSASAMAVTGLSAPITFKGGTYPGSGGNCSTILSSGASCTVVITYAPVAAGTTNRTLALAYHDGGSAQSTNTAISGTAIALASVAITAPVVDPYDFGAVVVGAPAEDVTITLQNTGGQSATALLTSGLAPPFGYKGGGFPGTGGNCTGTLAVGASCAIVVSYLPTGPGTFSDTLDITYHNGSTTQALDHTFQGTSGNSAILAIGDGPSYDYGTRTAGSNTDHGFVVTNSGGSPATGIADGIPMAAPFAFKGGAFPGTGGSCTDTLGAGATCTTVVTFSPVSTGGFSSTIDLAYFDGVSTLAASRPVTGTGGAVANLTISDGATYNYGSVATGSSAEKSFTVSNVGGSTASAIAPAAFAAPFSFKGGTFPGLGGNCTNSLGSGGSCTVVVAYSPTAAGASAGTLTLNYNDSVAAASSARALSGVGASITKIAGGSEHTCALYSTGIVKCWGSDFRGQLGNDAALVNSATPVAVSGVTSATDLAVGSEHSCVRLANGRIQCWGLDSSGQLGNDGTLTDSGVPALVASTTDFTRVAAAGNVTCGLRAGGTIQCWGEDIEGANGDDAGFTNNATPVTVSGLTSMTDVSVGRSHACGRRSDGTLSCWGSDAFGQLGDGGANTNSGIPVTPSGPITTALTTAAGGDLSCAILSGGAVSCWGADDEGQLGDDVALTSQTTPTAVSTYADAASLAIGRKHACARTSTNTAVCTGDDFYGQLGDDVGTTDEAVPVSVFGLTNIDVLGAGENHSCAVISTGPVYCWGANSAGQLGNGAPPANQPTPVQVQGL